MPLCTGVRPWHEDMPSKDKGEHVELYTSNTTAPILSILRRISAEPEVARDDLENSLMRNKVLTALQRKQLLNAVYGNEPDENVCLCLCLCLCLCVCLCQCQCESECVSE